ncbi:DUF3500 domain-containing protein [Azotobacter armeniacus]
MKTRRHRLGGALLLHCCFAWSDEPYRGIAFGEQVAPTIHRLASSGVGTEPIAAAANRLLAGLSEPERSRLSFAIDSKQWRIWSNFHRSAGRVGLRLGDLMRPGAGGSSIC